MGRILAQSREAMIRHASESIEQTGDSERMAMVR